MSPRSQKMSPEQLADTFFSVFYRAYPSAVTSDGVTTIQHEGVTIRLDTVAHTLQVGNDNPQPLQEGAEEMLRMQVEQARDRAVKIARTPPPAPRRIEMAAQPKKQPAAGGAPNKPNRSPDSKQPTSIALLPEDKRALAELSRREGLSQSEIVARAYKLYDRLSSRSPNTRLLLQDPDTKEMVEIWIA